MHFRYWLALLAMAFLSPLGLFAEGKAWGEWGAEELKQLVGFVPWGVEQSAEWWQAFFSEYSMKFIGNSRLAEKTGYLFSALLGSAVVYGTTMACIKVMKRNETKT